jgi:RNA polymerase sigma factor (sigma-70 family)
VCTHELRRDTHAAEDAFQATFLALFQQADRVRGSLPSWLHTVARRVSMRLRRRVQSLPTEDIPDPGDHDSLRIELNAVVAAEIAALRETERVPMVLSVYGGLTHAEVARELGWPIGTVASRLARAKSRLQSRLVRRGIGLAVLTSGWETIADAASDALLAQTIAMSSQPVSHTIQLLTTGALTTMTLAKYKLMAIAIAITIATGSVIVMAQDKKGEKAGTGSPANTATNPKNGVQQQIDFSDPNATFFPKLTASTTEIPWIRGEKKLPNRPSDVEYQILKASFEELQYTYRLYIQLIDGGASDVNSLYNLMQVQKESERQLHSLALFAYPPSDAIEGWTRDHIRACKALEKTLRFRLEQGTLRKQEYTQFRANRIYAELILYRLQNGIKPLR